MMEEVYTVKVKTKPDRRNLYPSERRYSASTVSGLAWVHIALAATSFILACLTLVNPSSEITRITLNDTTETIVQKDVIPNRTDFDEFAFVYADNETDVSNDNATIEEPKATKKQDVNYILVVAPMLVTVFALCAGIASIMASVRWYIDRNITWLFITSILSTAVAIISFAMVSVWFAKTEGDITEFYRDKIPFKDYFLVKHSDVVHKNDSHILIKTPSLDDNEGDPHLFTKRVLSINILIASFLELLWSLLSMKIAYKGMRSSYIDDNTRSGNGNTVSIVTTTKGDLKKLPRNGKLIPPRLDIMDPNSKIRRIFLEQADNGYYLRNQNNKTRNTETSSDFYKERMMNFLNRCASQAGNDEMNTTSEQSDVLNAIPEATKVEINAEPDNEIIESRMTPVSWGDSPNHTIYNQNNLNLDRIFKFDKDEKEEEEKDVGVSFRKVSL